MNQQQYQERVLELYLRSLLRARPSAYEQTVNGKPATDDSRTTGQGVPGGDGLYPGFFPGSDAVPGA